MLVPKLTKITKEEIQEAPNWINKLLDPINLFFSQTWSVLQNLTIGQNVIGKFVVLTIQTSATYTSGDFPATSFQWEFKKTPEAVLIAQVRSVGNTVVNTSALSVDWINTSNGIEILYVTGLKNSTKYNIRLLAL